MGWLEGRLSQNCFPNAAVSAGNAAQQGAFDDKPTADSVDIASATNYVNEALAALKAGTPIKTATTKSYGCFVKY